MSQIISLDVIEYIIIPFISREVMSTIIFHENWNFSESEFDKWFLELLYKQHWFDGKLLHYKFKEIIQTSEFTSNIDPYLNKNYKFLYSNHKIKFKSDLDVIYISSNNIYYGDKDKFNHILHKITFNSNYNMHEYIIFGFKYDLWFYIYQIYKDNVTNFFTRRFKQPLSPYYHHNIIQILKTKSLPEFINHEYTKKNYYIRFILQSHIPH